MSDPIFKNEELIIATVASLKKWENISKGKGYHSEECGFCTLILKYERKLRPDKSLCFDCPVHSICHENLDFWLEIDNNPRKSFNPGKFKYQQRRVQKNIDWLNDYLKELQK